MSQELLEYPKMMERALRGVLREALSIAAQHGLPGTHHFYITFRTTAAGVSIANRLLAQYPEEITIVLENQFWDLVVTEENFAVSLSFGGAHQHLVVPFEAVTSFVDPSVKFGLQFGKETEPGAVSEPTTPDVPDVPADAETADAEPQHPAADGDDGDDGGGEALDDGDDRVVTLDSFRKK